MTREIFFRIYSGKIFNDKFLFIFLLTGISLSFALAELNYRLLEIPLRKKGIIKAKVMSEDICFTLDNEKQAALLLLPEFLPIEAVSDS